MSASTDNFDILGQICCELHYWIMKIRVSLVTKFQFKLTILIVWTKFAQKMYFQLKTEKLSTTTKFYLRELVQAPSFNLN